MNIAITGGSGFIGQNLLNSLEKMNGLNLILIQRRLSTKSVHNELTFEDFFNVRTPKNIDLFIHLASPNFDKERKNELKNGIVELTKKILNVLPKYNCNRFIFFSSIKVYGESSIENIIFSEQNETNPISDYAKAKLKAENLVKEISKKNSINFLIYRLSFVFGKKMKSHIGLITKLMDNSIPLIAFNEKLNLKKSFLYIDNLKQIIAFNILNIESINNEIINLSDTEPLSLSEFIRSYKKNIKSKSLIINLNATLFKIFLKIPIISNLILKIFGSFQVDNKKIKTILNEDIISTNEGIKRFIEERNNDKYF